MHKKKEKTTSTNDSLINSIKSAHIKFICNSILDPSKEHFYDSSIYLKHYTARVKGAVEKIWKIKERRGKKVELK